MTESKDFEDHVKEYEERYVSVFRDKDKLSLAYVPDRLVHRGVEERYFARILVGIKKGYLPPMVRVSGRSGTGKTVVVRYVLERFRENLGEVFDYFYVNLKGCRTVSSAANAILSAICGRRVPHNLGADRAFNEIWSELRGLKKAGGKLLVVFVLDEVDTVFLDRHFDPSDFFYRFLRHQTFLRDPDIKVSLFTITNNPGALEDLDERVKSSMGSEATYFRAYSRGELRDILKMRAEEAFKPGVLEDGVIDLIAGSVSKEHGDARRAVELLRASGEIASEAGASMVGKEHVKTARGRVGRDWLKAVVKDLPTTNKMILTYLAWRLRHRERVTTRKAYAGYRSSSKQTKRGYVKERRFLDIINELDTLGILAARTISRGRYGRSKVISLRVNPHELLSVLAKAGMRWSSSETFQDLKRRWLSLRSQL